VTDDGIRLTSDVRAGVADGPCTRCGAVTTNLGSICTRCLDAYYLEQSRGREKRLLAEFPALAYRIERDKRRRPHLAFHFDKHLAWCGAALISSTPAIPRVERGQSFPIGICDRCMAARKEMESWCSSK
jgi:hypothetical protein